ncbi:hypothetical protein WMY93_017517 [Mugilogobius chulae]|uniref:Uncharacterized protein n=1 Tax=Mugilogobius chulae TaxID=88201 RepID=A0AAW0NT64_9GOBI
MKQRLQELSPQTNQLTSGSLARECFPDCPSRCGGAVCGVVAPGSVAGMQSSAVGTTVSIANPQSSSVGNVNMLSSANVPVRGGISTSASSSTSGFPLNVISSSGANVTTNTHAAIIQPQTNQNSNIAMTPSSSAAATSASGVMGVSAVQGRATAVPPVSAPHTTAPQQSAQAHPATATTSSRFRVLVRSDSSSVGVRQYVSESFAGPTERETTSCSSVSSSVSTLSHYADSVCSNESTQHAQDYSSPPHGFQPVAPGAVNHMYAQEAMSQVKTTVAQTNVHLPVSMTSLQSQQPTYAQAVASSGPVPVPVQPQKVNYPVPQQAAPGQGRSEYTQPLSNVVGSANSQIIGAPQTLQATSVPPHVGAMSGQSHLDGPQQKPQSLPTQIQTPSLAPLSATSAPPHSQTSDPKLLLHPEVQVEDFPRIPASPRPMLLRPVPSTPVCPPSPPPSSRMLKDCSSSTSLLCWVCPRSQELRPGAVLLRGRRLRATLPPVP